MSMNPSDFDPESRVLFGSAALAVLGGAVRALRTPQSTTRKFFVELVTSLFAGILSGLFMQGAGLPWYYFMALVGASGWVAPRVLDYFGAKVCSMLSVPEEGGEKQ